MNEKIKELVIEAVKELNENLQIEELNNPTEKTKLYGTQGHLDSLSLVNLIVDIEERMANELDRIVTLADEKAMSQVRSPFRSVGELVSYIDLLVNQEEA